MVSGRRTFPWHRSGTARFRGAMGSEDVGISNFKPDENSGHRKPKVSQATSIGLGLVGPKVTAEKPD